MLQIFNIRGVTVKECILVVEDDVDINNLIKKSLEKNNY